MTDNAVVYVAWGSGIKEANKSLASLKKHTPNVASYLFTDDGTYADGFDHVERAKAHSSRPVTKVNGILKSLDVVTEDNALYLDSDTLVIADIGDLFTTQYDMAIAYAPFNRSGVTPVFNSGVIEYIVYSNYVMNLIYDWSKGVVGETADQYVLSDLIHKEHFEAPNVLTLPPNYNLRTGWPECVQGEVKILHGRYNLDEVAKVINEKPKQRRVWIPGKGMMYK